MKFITLCVYLTFLFFVVIVKSYINYRFSIYNKINSKLLRHQATKQISLNNNQIIDELTPKTLKKFLTKTIVGNKKIKKEFVFPVKSSLALKSISMPTIKDEAWR